MKGKFADIKSSEFGVIDGSGYEFRGVELLKIKGGSRIL